MASEFFSRLSRVDRILDAGPSGGSDKAELLGLIQDPEVGKYYFDQIEDPRWLDVLPDDVFEDLGPGRGWQAAEYLVKVVDRRPRDVLRILENVLPSGELRILRYAVRAVARAVDYASPNVVAVIREGLDESVLPILASDVADLALALLDKDRVDEGIGILGDLLELEAPVEDAPFGTGMLPKPLIRPWQYEEIITDVLPEAFSAAPMETWSLILETLELGLARAEAVDESNRAKLGYWRAAVEQHAQNEPENHLDLLVASGRDMALQLIERQVLDAADVLNQLSQHDGVIFERLELYLLQNFKSELTDRIRDRLTSEELFNSTSHHHEYYHLLRVAFDLLTEELQEQVLNWVDQRCSVAETRVRLAEMEGRDVPRAEAQTVAEHRLIRALSAIEDHLDTERRRQYEQLVEKHGEPDHPDFLTYHYPVRTGPQSPVDDRSLAAESVDQIITQFPRLLARGRKEEAWVMPDEGLTRQLSRAVTERVGEFSEAAPRFMEAGPKAVEAVLSGLRNALDDESGELHWEPILHLCSLAMEPPYEYSADTAGQSEASDWARVRRRVADLIAKGLAEESNRPDVSLREEVWRILDALMEDPNPPFIGKMTSELEPATEALNTTRGQALHGVFRYCWWVKKASEGGSPKGSTEVDLSQMTEAVAVLQRHLDPAEDSSLAIRAVYGQWFPSMVGLDEQWTREIRDRVFPQTAAEGDYWRAAWETYLTFWGAIPRVYDILRLDYKRAIERIEKGIEQKDDSFGLKDPRTELGRHLVAFYWQGTLDEHGDRELLEWYLSVVEPKLRVKTLKFVGNSLRTATDSELSSKVLNRLKSLWTRRVEEAQTSPEVGLELEGFVDWFASEAFETEWALRMLHATLDHAKTFPQYPSRAIIRLGEVAHLNPKASLDSLISLTNEQYGIHTIRVHLDAAKAVLGAALASQEPAVRNRAEEFIDNLGRRGLVNEFRDMAAPAED
jgi:hypothetical protein